MLCVAQILGNLCQLRSCKSFQKIKLGIARSAPCQLPIGDELSIWLLSSWLLSLIHYTLPQQRKREEPDFQFINYRASEGSKISFSVLKKKNRIYGLWETVREIERGTRRWKKEVKQIVREGDESVVIEWWNFEGWRWMEM